MDQIFPDLKVIEFASVLAGPAVGMFFSELGANVIKYENKNSRGDVTRSWRTPDENPDRQSAYYSSVNWGKQSRLVNLKNEKEKADVIAEIVEADIVISNARDESATKLGFNWEQVKAINDKVIYGQIRGFRKRTSMPAYDVVLQAECGYISMCGTHAGEATKMPVALIDVLAAHQLKEGILLAMLHKYKTGLGSYVDVALDEVAISSLVNQATNYLMNGKIAKRMGTLHPNIAPYGEILITSDDSEIALAIGSNNHFRNLLMALELPDELFDDQRFNSNQLRLQHRKELNTILMNQAASYTSKLLVGRLEEHDVPFGIVRNLAEVFDEGQYDHLLLDEDLEGGYRSKCVKTTVFNIINY